MAAKNARGSISLKEGPPCQLDSVLSQQLAGYALIEKDLRNVLVWLEEIDTIFPKTERPRGDLDQP